VIPAFNYFVYGEEQCDLNFRPEYLQTALEISGEDESLIESVSSGDTGRNSCYFVSRYLLIMSD
jgi:hypothetical protein